MTPVTPIPQHWDNCMPSAYGVRASEPRAPGDPQLGLGGRPRQAPERASQPGRQKGWDVARGAVQAPQGDEGPAGEKRSPAEVPPSRTWLPGGYGWKRFWNQAPQAPHTSLRNTGNC